MAAAKNPKQTAQEKGSGVFSGGPVDLAREGDAALEEGSMNAWARKVPDQNDSRPLFLTAKPPIFVRVFSAPTTRRYQLNSALIRASRPVRIEFACSQVPPGTKRVVVGQHRVAIQRVVQVDRHHRPASTEPEDLRETEIELVDPVAVARSGLEQVHRHVRSRFPTAAARAIAPRSRRAPRSWPAATRRACSGKSRSPERRSSESCRTPRPRTCVSIP